MQRVGTRMPPAGAVLIVTLAVIAACLAGCVETAECDESTGCPDGEVCFEYECHARCDEDEDCGKQNSCRPCEDPESDENHCFGATVKACVETDAQSG